MSARAAGSRSGGRCTSIRTWYNTSVPLGVKDEVVDHRVAAVGLFFGVEHQLRLDRGGDVVGVVRVPREIQLGSEQFVAGRGHLHVEMRWTPSVPAGGGDELAAGAVGGDLVGRGPDGGYGELAVGAGREAATQVPFRNARGKLRVVAVGVGVPKFDFAGQRAAVGGGDGAVPHQRGALLVLAHGQRRVRAEFGGVGHVVRAFDAALVAVPVRGGDILDRMLNPDVKKQRPFAVLADLD